MKKLVFSSIAALAVASSVSLPAFANVLRSTGQSTGRPVAVQSNPGSIQAQIHRSLTGTTNKYTHDGLRELW